MLPYTTYTIPERSTDKTPASGHWLHFVTEQAFSSSQLELVKKIGTALQADFDKDTYLVMPSQPGDPTIQTLTGASTKLIISFGILPAQMGLWIDLESPGIRYLESFTFILTLPIDVLENNPAAKKELWKYMQMFMEMNKH
jgi:hypothetical protein